MGTVGRKGKVLIAEDSATTRETLKIILRSLGFTEFLEAENGRKALELLQGVDDVVLIMSDWRMPEMPGIKLLEQVQESARLRKIPFIMVTVVSEIDEVQRAALMGVWGYVTKPFDKQAIKEEIAGVFAEQDALLNDEQGDAE